MIENRALKMQQLNPSVITDVKRSRQHENKRHQRNNDVRLRNNYSPDVRKVTCHPRRICTKAHKQHVNAPRGRGGWRYWPGSEGGHFEA